MIRKTANGKTISPIDDARRYHRGNGNVNSTSNGLRDNPFYIVPVGKYSDPFKLVFDTDNYSVTVKAGALRCYGRLVEVPSDETVIDDITLEYMDSALRCYVYVYLRIDLDNIGSESVKFVVDYVKTNGTQDVPYPPSENLDDQFSLAYGVYDIPIASFMYDPKADDVSGIFTRPSYYIRKIPAGEKETANLVPLLGKVGGTSAQVLLDGLTDGVTLVPKNANEADSAYAFGEEGDSLTMFNPLIMREYTLIPALSGARFDKLDHSEIYFSGKGYANYSRVNFWTLMVKRNESTSTLIQSHDDTEGRKNNSYDFTRYGFRIPYPMDAKDGSVIASICVRVRIIYSSDMFVNTNPSYLYAGFRIDQSQVDDPKNAVEFDFGEVEKIITFPFIQLVKVSDYYLKVVINRKLHVINMNGDVFYDDYITVPNIFQGMNGSLIIRNYMPLDITKGGV